MPNIVHRFISSPLSSFSDWRWKSVVSSKAPAAKWIRKEQNKQTERGLPKEPGSTAGMICLASHSVVLYLSCSIILAIIPWFSLSFSGSVSVCLSQSSFGLALIFVLILVVVYFEFGLKFKCGFSLSYSFGLVLI